MSADDTFAMELEEHDRRFLTDEEYVRFCEMEIDMEPDEDRDH